jgi:hypothetical protein
MLLKRRRRRRKATAILCYISRIVEAEINKVIFGPHLALGRSMVLHLGSTIIKAQTSLAEVSKESNKK